MRPFKKLSPQSQAKESEKSHGNNLTIIWPKRLKERTIVQHDQMKTLFYQKSLKNKWKIKNSKLIKGFIIEKSNDDNRFIRVQQHKVMDV